MNDKKLLPMRIDKNGLAISHLFFEDDYLLFTKVKSSQVRMVQEVSFVDIQDTRLLVKDICFDGQWHWDRCVTLLSSDIKQKIMSTFVDGVSVYAYIWGHASSGIYSAKSAYSWLMSHNSLTQVAINNWTWLWGLKLPENIKFFLWLCIHGSLP